MPPEDYMIEYEEGGLQFCILGIMGSNFGLYILGDSFLRTYLSVYDFENYRVGLGLHIYSNGVVDLHKNTTVWMLPLILTVVFLVLITIGIFIYKGYKKRQLSKNLMYYESLRAQQVDRRLYGENGERTEWLNPTGNAGNSNNNNDNNPYLR